MVQRSERRNQLDSLDWEGATIRHTVGATSERAAREGRSGAADRTHQSPVSSQPSSRSSGVRHCILSYLAFRASRPLARSLDRRPRSRAAEGLLVGPSRGRRCTPASYAGRTRGARGGGPVSGARRPRAGRYRRKKPRLVLLSAGSAPHRWSSPRSLVAIASRPPKAPSDREASAAVTLFEPPCRSPHSHSSS